MMLFMSSKQTSDRVVIEIACFDPTGQEAREGKAKDSGG